jgi:5-methylcytosine-specific restriction endonuclease McrA
MTKNRLAQIGVDSIMPLIPAYSSRLCHGSTTKDSVRRWVMGWLVRTSTPILLLIKSKGNACAHCGATLSFFALEHHAGHTSLRPYAITDTGDEVLLTLDHIIPKSHPLGRNTFINYQVLCVRCNTRKDNKVPALLIQATGATA